MTKKRLDECGRCGLHPCECDPSIGANIIQSGRLFLLPAQRADLVIEIRNGDFDFRFISGWTEPLSDLIDVEDITLRRPGQESDTQLMRGDPMRLQMLTSDPRFGQAFQFLEALDSAENKSEVIFTLVNLEAIQGVTVNIALTGKWQVRPILPLERRPGGCAPGVKPPEPQRRDAEAKRGPLEGVKPY